MSDLSTGAADLSVTPLDVGFDLRLNGIAVALPAEATSVDYDDGGNVRRIRGSTLQIKAALEAAGYEVHIAEIQGPSEEQLRALRSEAAEAGDLAQVAVSNRALDGDDGAIRECARVLAEVAS